MPSIPSLFTDLVAFNYLYEPDDHLIARHIHHFHQLDVVLAGSICVELEDETVMLSGGDAMLVPPLVRHGYREQRGFQQGSFKFVLAPWCWSLFGNRARHLRVRQPLLEMIAAAGERYASRSILGVPNALAVATLCLNEFLEENNSSLLPGTELDSFRQSLWPMLEEIETNPDADWSVARMASQCCLSPDYFSHRFREVMAQSPHDYLIKARMRASAAALLATPAQPIKLIAERSGYSGVHAFTRVFTKIFGVSPGNYRRESMQMKRH